MSWAKMWSQIKIKFKCPFPYASFDIIETKTACSQHPFESSVKEMNIYFMQPAKTTQPSLIDCQQCTVVTKITVCNEIPTLHACTLLVYALIYKLFLMLLQRFLIPMSFSSPEYVPSAVSLWHNILKLGQINNVCVRLMDGNSYSKSSSSNKRFALLWIFIFHLFSFFLFFFLRIIDMWKCSLLLHVSCSPYLISFSYVHILVSPYIQKKLWCIIHNMQKYYIYM